MNDIKCGTINYEEGQNVNKISCGDDGVVGTQVGIVGSPNEFLTLCEVKVMVNKSIDLCSPDSVFGVNRSLICNGSRSYSNDEDEKSE